ncbi:MAG: YlbD family protein [Erysipelotrichaceae bacterium]|nr:YlbD family protein [Erysipelotrichaceae bacterium]
MNIDSFKSFIRTIPSIRDEVESGRYSWQQLYEYYILYGEDDKIWEPYKKDNHNDLSYLLDILKNIDLEALSKTFEGLQQVLSLLSAFMLKEEKTSSWYDD